MLVRQRQRLASMSAAHRAQVDGAGGSPDVVALWRNESSDAALRFIDKLSAVEAPA
jgi:hypothetical protein